MCCHQKCNRVLQAFDQQQMHFPRPAKAGVSADLRLNAVLKPKNLTADALLWSPMPQNAFSNALGAASALLVFPANFPEATSSSPSLRQHFPRPAKRISLAFQHI